MKLEKKRVVIAGDVLIEYTLRGKLGCFVMGARWERDDRASVAKQLWGLRDLLRRQEGRAEIRRAKLARKLAAEQRQKGKA